MPREPRNVKYSEDQRNQVRYLWSIDREEGGGTNHGRHTARAISKMTGVAPKSVWAIAHNLNWKDE